MKKLDKNVIVPPRFVDSRAPNDNSIYLRIPTPMLGKVKMLAGVMQVKPARLIRGILNGFFEQYKEAMEDDSG